MIDKVTLSQTIEERFAAADRDMKTACEVLGPDLDILDQARVPLDDMRWVMFLARDAEILALLKLYNIHFPNDERYLSLERTMEEAVRRCSSNIASVLSIGREGTSMTREYQQLAREKQWIIDEQRQVIAAYEKLMKKIT